MAWSKSTHTHSVRRKSYWERTARKATLEMRGRGKEGCGSVRRRFRLENIDVRLGKLKARMCVGMIVGADFPKKEKNNNKREH